MSIAKVAVLWIAIQIAIVWFLLYMLGEKFDSIHVEGRISAEQAAAINQLPWGKCPRYRNGRCWAQEGDRIISREFSEFMRWIQLR